MYSPSVSVPLQLHLPEDVLEQLAERVRALRLEFAWKQSTLAERAGVSLPTVARYERTGRTSLENLLRICHALGRLDEFAALLEPAPAASLDALERAAEKPGRKRGAR